jgi:hypothetical protein
MDKKSDNSARSLEGDFVVIGKQDFSSKKGVLFVEARIRDELMEDPQLTIGVSQVSNAIVLVLLSMM